MVRTLALILLEECPKLVEQIEHAIQVRDAKELQRAAHTLKGSSSHFFAIPVQTAAGILEKCGEQADFDEAPKVLADVKLEADRLMQAIRDEFDA
jgi:HPt (histidine-containing phosphotransfer) domain-containing protein